MLTRTLLLGTLAIAVAGNLPAQRGGAPAGRFAAPAARPVAPVGGRSFVPSRNYPAPPGLWRPAAGYTGINRGALRSERHASRLPFAYWAAPYYYPPLDYSDNSYTGPAPDMGYDPSAEAAMMAQDALANQVQRLSAQVAQLQYGQQPQPPAYAQQDSQPPPVPVTLVLRSGQQLQVQNYAVMDQTFWDFTKQPARKIPLSSIDVTASAKATQANGGEFPQLEAMQ